MSKINKYNLEGEVIESVEFEDQSTNSTLNPQSIKDYIIALRKNKRQWSANTKGRSEIAHSNAKPHPQKGTGRARQGCIKTAQYKGGATVFGPKPKFNQHVRINKKERRAAIYSLLNVKMRSGNIRFLNIDNIKEPKTKSITKFLKLSGIEQKKILFLCDAKEDTKNKRENLYLSMRNIPKTSFRPLSNFSGYDIISNQEVVVLDSALDDFIKVMRSNNGK